MRINLDVFFLLIVNGSGLLPGIVGRECYLGKATNGDNRWRWLLTDFDPCLCTSLKLSGKNGYLISDDINQIRNFMQVTCDISDTENPVIVDMPADIVESTDTGLATATAIWVSPTAHGNSGSQTLTSSHNPGESFTIGMTMVNYTSTDAAGNVVTNTFNVEGKDTEKPIIVGMPNDIIQSTDIGLSTANVSWFPPNASDNSGSQTLTSNHIPGESFPIGVTMVNYTSTDAAGNIATQTFNVIVEDTEEPVIIGMPNDIIQSTDIGLATANVSWLSPNASDNSGSQTLTSNHNPGESFPIGVTIVNYTSTDAAGNIAIQTFNVIVEDTEDPIISHMTDIIETIQNIDVNGAPVTWSPPTATDNSGVQTLISSHAPGESFPCGVHSVTYTSTDPSGNVATEAFRVTIQGHWIAIQRRINGSLDFYRGWDEYERGFGLSGGEFWAGLQRIHQFTNNGVWRLRVDLEAFDGSATYAEYEPFTVLNATTYYKVRVGAYNGTAGDSFTYNNNYPFSTKDRDFTNNCAAERRGAWWYKSCTWINLNGLYFESPQTTWQGIMWYHWRSTESLKMSEMKIRCIG